MSSPAKPGRTQATSTSSRARYDLSKLDETEIAELGIGRKFQKPTVFDMHSVEDNLMLALKNDRRVRATLMWENTRAAGSNR